MAMLDRYRKSGGFFQLVQLLETSVPSKKEKFLALIREESPAWENELKKYLFTFDKILNLSPESLREIWPRISEKVVSTAVWNLPPEQKEKFFQTLTIAQKRKFDEAFSMNPPTPGEILASQLRVIQEVRSMTQVGYLRLDKIAPEMVIPEKIEELLSDPAGYAPGLAEKLISQARELSQNGGSGSVSGAALQNTSPSSAGAAASGNNPAAVMLVEEMKDLRRRMQTLASENNELRQENQALRDKLEQIRKIA